MIPGWSVRYWSASGDGACLAAELRASRPGAGSLRAMARLVSAKPVNFLIVPVADVTTVRLDDAIKELLANRAGVHIVLSGSRSSLDEVAATVSLGDRIGLMLDGMDESTPLTNLLWDRLECVRFSAEFVYRASQDLRVGFVLESMLTLSKDLGLCSLGSAADAHSRDHFEFDYSLAGIEPTKSDAGRETRQATSHLI